MDWTNLSDWIFIFALFVGLTTYCITSRCRRSTYVDFIRRFCLHHVFVAFLIGYSSPTSLVDIGYELVSLSVLILIAWFASMLGATLDMRLVRYFEWRKMGMEFLTYGGLMILIIILPSFFPEFASISFWNLVALFATAALCWSPQEISDRHVRIVRRDWWMPSGAMMLGLIALGMAGLFQRQLIPISIARPFASPVVFHSPIDFAMLSLIMGCVLGLLLDLSTRGLSKKYIAYVASAGLMVLVGIGASVGLDPVWIGFIGGIWFINTTIERREVVSIFGQGDKMLNRCIFFICGIIIGIQSASKAIDFSLAFWFSTIFIVQAVVGALFFKKKSVVDNTGVDRSAFKLSMFAILGFFSMFLTGNKGESAGVLLIWILLRLVWENGGGSLFSKIPNLIVYSNSRQKH